MSRDDDVLSSAVRTLSVSTDPARLLGELATLIVPALADWCLADVLEPPDLVTRVVAVGRDGPLAVPSSLGPVEARRSSARAFGLLVHLQDAPGRRLRLSPEQLRSFLGAEDAKLRRQAELALSLGIEDLLVLGLSGGDELLGVLSVGRVDGQLEPEAVRLLEDLAALAGMALNGVRLRELQRGVSTALQRSLLPQLPAVPGLTLAARFTPAGQALSVGGDWYDVFLLPDGDVALVVGDATGHDVQAAARMAELRNLLRAVAVDRHDSPARTLSRLDRLTEQVAGHLSGTCVYAQVSGRDGGRRLRWSSAGHLPPVLLRSGAARLLDTPADLMLGVRPDTDRSDHEVALQVGDVLVLYTDGLVEDRRAGLDERLEVLRQLVETLAAVSSEQLVDDLIAQLASHEDDVAVLVVRVDPLPADRADPGR